MFFFFTRKMPVTHMRTRPSDRERKKVAEGTPETIRLPRAVQYFSFVMDALYHATNRVGAVFYVPLFPPPGNVLGT